MIYKHQYFQLNTQSKKVFDENNKELYLTGNSYRMLNLLCEKGPSNLTEIGEYLDRAKDFNENKLRQYRNRIKTAIGKDIVEYKNKIYSVIGKVEEIQEEKGYAPSIKERNTPLLRSKEYDENISNKLKKINMQVTLNRECFKIDSANAKAMIEGFYKDGKLIHQCIYCLTGRDRVFPKLITRDIHPAKESELSDVGRGLHAEDYEIPLKYVADLVQEYHIKNDIGLWDKICNNSLFDIWDKTAPSKLFDDAKTDPNKFRIALLRIYEIDKKFSQDDIEPYGGKWHNRYHRIREGVDLNVNLIKPVVNDEDFQQIKSLLETSINGYEL